MSAEHKTLHSAQLLVDAEEQRCIAAQTINAALRDGHRFQTVYALLFAADAGDNVARNILIQTKLMAEPGKQSKNMQDLRQRCDAAIALVDSMEWQA